MKKLVLILPVLILLLSGCVSMGPTNGPNMGRITLQFVDRDTGEPLEGGYVFKKEHWSSIPKYIGSRGWKLRAYGGEKVLTLNENGEITFPVIGYRAIKGSVFVKNYESGGFSLFRSSYLSNLKFHLTLQKSELPERFKANKEYERSITVSKRHYKIPLKDITSDSEGWADKLVSFSGDIPRYEKYSSEYTGNLSREEYSELIEYHNAEVRSYLDKYSYETQPWINWKTGKRENISPQFEKASMGKSSTYLQKLTPRQCISNKVTIAVLDSGINENYSFESIMKDPINISNTDSTEDYSGHGTYLIETVRKTVDYIDKNSKIDLQILPIKVTDNGGLSTPSSMASGIRYAVKQNPDIILIGSGTYKDYKQINEAVDYAKRNNKIIIAPAGNDGVSQPFYPAAYPEVIGVGSYGKDEKYMGHNYGNWVDIYAPGENLNGYNGTSGAAAVVAGIVASSWPVDTGNMYYSSLLKKNIDSKSARVRNNSTKIRNKRIIPQWGVETHEGITEASIEKSLRKSALWEDIYSELISEDLPFRDQLLRGSHQEDWYDGIDGDPLKKPSWLFGLPSTPFQEGRYLNHFWHKKMNRELTVFDSVRTNALRWGLTYEPNDYRWEDAIERYGYTNDTKRQSYYTLGFVAHLTQDMLVPEHVHDDPHAPIGDPSTLEDYVEAEYDDDYINALADDSIADITSPYKAFAEGNEFGYKQNLFIPETSFSRNNGDERDNAFGIGEYTVKLETDVPAPRKATSEGKVI